MGKRQATMHRPVVVWRWWWCVGKNGCWCLTASPCLSAQFKRNSRHIKRRHNNGTRFQRIGRVSPIVGKLLVAPMCHIPFKQIAKQNAPRASSDYLRPSSRPSRRRTPTMCSTRVAKQTLASCPPARRTSKGQSHTQVEQTQLAWHQKD